MTEREIIQAYCRIREIDNSIPDNILDLMRDSAIEKLAIINSEAKKKEPCPKCGEPMFAIFTSEWHDVEKCGSGGHRPAIVYTSECG